MLVLNSVSKRELIPLNNSIQCYLIHFGNISIMKRALMNSDGIHPAPAALRCYKAEIIGRIVKQIHLSSLRSSLVSLTGIR